MSLFRKKETSPAYEFKKDASPLIQLRQELAQCNALLLHSRLGWGGIDEADDEPLPEHVESLLASICAYVTIIRANPVGKNYKHVIHAADEAVTLLAAATERAAWVEYKSSGVARKALEDYITGERIIKAVTRDKELLKNEATLQEALDSIIAMRRSLGEASLPIMETITEGLILQAEVEKLQKRITKKLKREKELTEKTTLTAKEQEELTNIEEKLTKEAVELQHKKTQADHNTSLQVEYKNLVASKDKLLNTQESAILNLQTYLKLKRDEEQLQGITAKLSDVAGGGLEPVQRAADEAKATLQGWNEIRAGQEEELNTLYAHNNAEEYLNEQRKNL